MQYNVEIKQRAFWEKVHGEIWEKKNEIVYL